MACFHPLKAYRGRGGVPVFKVPLDTVAIPMDLPCGQCIGCRLERSRQWAVRCMHEASLHEDNCFITLTYDDANLPADGSLDKRHWQLFAKRLRKRVGRFRFFHCGEYGSQLMRPHYHACLFGVDFSDKVYFKSAGGESKLYTSMVLDDVWGLGFATIGDVTFESAAYVARYVMKKVTGKGADEYYGGLQPEYTTMSRRPGIASDWFRKWSNEVFPSDEVIVRGFPCRPPRYYDNLYEVAEPTVFDEIKRKRRSDIATHAADLTPERLLVREKCTKARVSLLKRPVEDG